MANEAGRNDGFALVVVLGFLMLVALLLLPFATSSRLRALTTANHFEQRRLSYAAEAFNTYLAQSLAAEKSSLTTLSASGYPRQYRCRAGKLTVVIDIADQMGLVDLNQADEQLLAAGFDSVGLEEGKATMIAAAVRAYRSPNAQEPKTLPSALQPENGFKHGPFEDIVELQDFPALRTIPLPALGRAFTVHSRSASIAEGSSEMDLQKAMLQRQRRPTKNLDATSSIYRFTTVLQSAGGSGSSSLIFKLIFPEQIAVKQAALRVPEPESFPNEQARPCSAVLGAKLANLLDRRFSR